MGISRWAGRTTCESCESIDVRYLHRRRLLSEARGITLSWEQDGEQFGEIRILAQPDRLILASYPRDDHWTNTLQSVQVDWTPCRYGGRRPWILCPGDGPRRHCGRRVAILYRLGEYFACRHCHGLAYASQHESLIDRAYSRARKIRTQLGGSLNLLEPIPEKPKGMHWRTYQRLLRRAQDAEMATTSFMVAGLESLR